MGATVTSGYLMVKKSEQKKKPREKRIQMRDSITGEPIFSLEISPEWKEDHTNGILGFYKELDKGAINISTKKKEKSKCPESQYKKRLGRIHRRFLSFEKP